MATTKEIGAFSASLFFRSGKTAPAPDRRHSKEKRRGSFIICDVDSERNEERVNCHLAIQKQILIFNHTY